jgi:hypothetical protein
MNKRKIEYIRKNNTLVSKDILVSKNLKKLSLKIDIDIMTGYILESDNILYTKKGDDLKQIKKTLKKELINTFNVIFQDYVPLEGRVKIK